MSRFAASVGARCSSIVDATPGGIIGNGLGCRPRSSRRLLLLVVVSSPDSLCCQTVSEALDSVSIIAVLRTQTRGFWTRAAVWTLVTATAIALPARLVPNDLFRRMTPTRPQDYVFWIVGSVLVGLVLAFGRSPRAEASGIVGGTATLLAVGCPVCNKVVVALIGTAGALEVFAPLQPVLGTAAIGLLVWSLRRRARLAAGGCAVPAENPAR